MKILTTLLLSLTSTLGLAQAATTYQGSTTIISFGAPSTTTPSGNTNVGTIDFGLAKGGTSNTVTSQTLNNFDNQVIQSITATRTTGTIKIPGITVPTVTGFEDIPESSYSSLIQSDGGENNSQTPATITLTLSGLLPNQDYCITLYSARTNSWANNATYSLTGVDNVLTSTSKTEATIEGTTVSNFNTSGNISNAGTVTWKFTTSDNPTDIIITANGNWSINALSISIPEPTTASLSLLALAALMSRRRR